MVGLVPTIQRAAHALRPRSASRFSEILETGNATLRTNRVALLAEIRAATLTVADFSKIAG